MKIRSIYDKDRGLRKARNRVRQLYDSGFGQEEFNQIKAKAQSGDHFAQFKLGLFYRHGIVVGSCPRTGAEWYRRAAEGGNAEAALELGIASVEGVGVPKSFEVAAKFFEQAASAGVVEAHLNLASIYLTESEALYSPSQAVVHLKRAAEMNHPIAQARLCHLLWKGLGVTRDRRIAIRWLFKSLRNCWRVGLEDDKYPEGLGDRKTW